MFFNLVYYQSILKIKNLFQYQMTSVHDQTKNTYSTNYSEYIDKFNTTGSRDADIDEVFALSHKENPLTIELGCAGGRDAITILRYTNKYIGIDYVPEFIDYAKAHVQCGSFLLADLENYTPPTETDIIFAFASLLHTNKETLRNIFTRIYSSLSTNGLVRISLKQADDYAEQEETDAYGTRTFYYYGESDIRDLTSQFTILFLRTIHFADKKWIEILLQK